MALEINPLVAREISLRLAETAMKLTDQGMFDVAQIVLGEAQEVCRRAGPPSPEIAAQAANAIDRTYRDMHQGEEVPIPLTPEAAEAQFRYMTQAVFAEINAEFSERKQEILAEIESRPLEPVTPFSETNWFGWRVREMRLLDRITNYPYSIPGVGRVVVEEAGDGGSPIILARSGKELMQAVNQGAELVEK